MNKTIIIFKHEFKNTLKRKSFILITIAFPLLAMLGHGIYQGVQHWYHPAAPEELKIGYIDQTGRFNEYTSQLSATMILYPGEEEAKEALLAEEIKEYFVIPVDYLSTGRVIRYTMEREVEPPTKTMKRIRAFLLSNLLAGETSPEIIERAKTPMMLASFRLDKSGEIVSPRNVLIQFFLPIIFAVPFMPSILFTSGYLLESVAEEKESRVIEVLLSSVSSRQLFVGKVLGLGSAGLTQIAIWLTSIKVFTEVARVNIPGLSGLSIPLSLLAVGLVYYILGYLLYAVLSASVGSIGSTTRESHQWSGIFVMPAVIVIALSSLIIRYPEHIVSRAFTLFPLTAPIAAMMRLPAQAIPVWELILSIAILAGSVVLGMWAAAKVFRTCLLMYGKRPSFKEIVRFLKGA